MDFLIEAFWVEEESATRAPWCAMKEIVDSAQDMPPYRSSKHGELLKDVEEKGAKASGGPV